MCSSLVVIAFSAPTGVDARAKRAMKAPMQSAKVFLQIMLWDSADVLFAMKSDIMSLLHGCFCFAVCVFLMILSSKNAVVFLISA
jgi:hypothetical protein